MSNVLAALVLLAVGAWVGAQTLDGYRDGRVTLFGFGFVNPFVFARSDNAAFFWGAVVIDGALTLICTLGGAVILIAGMRTA